jgi:hypothetical protein
MAGYSGRRPQENRSTRVEDYSSQQRRMETDSDGGKNSSRVINASRKRRSLIENI